MSHVMILAGGLSHERDVSLRSGRRVADALSRSGAEVHVRDVDQTLVDAIKSSPPEVVWPVLPGATGEDGALRDVLASLGIAYVGSRPASCHLTWDTPVATALLAAEDISMVEDAHGQMRSLPAVEIVPDGGVYSYEARYTAGATEFFTPARLSAS